MPDLAPPVLRQDEPEPASQLALHLLPQALRCDLLKGEISLAKERPVRFVDLSHGLGVQLGTEEAVEEVGKARGGERERQRLQVLGSDVLE